jgi:hypothetical protein
MKRLIAALWLFAVPALAQPAPRGPDPNALSQELLECVGSKVDLRTREIASRTSAEGLQAKVVQLEAELAKLKAPAAAETRAETLPPAAEPHAEPQPPGKPNGMHH